MRVHNIEPPNCLPSPRQKPREAGFPHGERRLANVVATQFIFQQLRGSIHLEGTTSKLRATTRHGAFVSTSHS